MGLPCCIKLITYPSTANALNIILYLYNGRLIPAGIYGSISPLDKLKIRHISISGLTQPIWLGVGESSVSERALGDVDGR